MLSLLNFLRTFYVPTQLYAQRNFRTSDSYLQSVSVYLEANGDIKIDDICLAAHARFFQFCKVTNLANETIRKHCRNLNVIFSSLGPDSRKNPDAFGFLQAAPWIRPPKAFHRLPKSIGDSPIDQLLAAVHLCPETHIFPKHLEEGFRPIYWKTLIEFVITTGLRRNAVFNLKYGDISADSKFISVQPEIDKCQRGRLKPLHSTVYNHLQIIRTESPYLFPWTHGDKKWYEIWHKLNFTAKTDLKLHDLKRYALQRAIRSGCDIATLQALGDHSTIQTTLRHYVTDNLVQYVNSMNLESAFAQKGGVS